MISKQGFLDMIQKQIFPILSLYQREMKLLSILSFKKLIFGLFISSIIFSFIFCIIFSLTLNSDFDYLISVLLSIIISASIFLYLIHYSNKTSNKIGKMIMPKIFSALNVEDHPDTDKDYNFLENLSNYGFLPDFDTPFIFKSCTLKKTYYDLFAQFLGLWVDTEKRSKTVFSGCLVSSKKICLSNSSLLILDKQLKYNPTQKELTRSYPTKSLEKGRRWKVIDCDNSWFSDNFTTYGINIYNSEKIFPSFYEGLKKLKSIYSVPISILINRYGIFIAIETEDGPFPLVNMDLKAYEKLYDTFKNLGELDTILSDFESKI